MELFPFGKTVLFPIRTQDGVICHFYRKFGLVKATPRLLLWISCKVRRRRNILVSVECIEKGLYPIFLIKSRKLYFGVFV